MTLGDWIVFVITWGTVVAGSYALVRLAWERWGAFVLGVLSMLFVERTPEIMSRAPASEPSSPSGLKTDGASIVVAPAAPEPSRDEILDACKVMRAHGMSREDARLVFVRLHRKLDNNLWTQAAPADSDELVTPYAGRRTRASYYPDRPDLEYVEP